MRRYSCAAAAAVAAAVLWVAPARALVNPLLQPFHLCERYGTVAVFTVGAVDDDGRTAQLSLRQCVKGAWAAPKVQIAAKAPELKDAFLTFMIKGETVVAFTDKQGGRRGAGDVLFYVADGRWQLAAIEDPARPDQWLWREDTGEAYFGTFNGRADRLVEIVADHVKGRYYYPAKPLSRFRPDVSVGRLPGPGRGLALYDLDGDGDLDVYACSLEGDRAFVQINKPGRCPGLHLMIRLTAARAPGASSRRLKFVRNGEPMVILISWGPFGRGARPCSKAYRTA